ncbi:response regulator [Gemmata sp. JC717]|uniref:ATP-binding protein n=1 Tax=Gemmata algarum TaxID=2975278 RepID=UPI0021BA78F4|nr:ATP-binding protein [Gemmata algarum]MDY3552437.1 response regulator [Gemmata algarum]
MLASALTVCTFGLGWGLGPPLTQPQALTPPVGDVRPVRSSGLGAAPVIAAVRTFPAPLLRPLTLEPLPRHTLAVVVARGGQRAQAGPEPAGPPAPAPAPPDPPEWAGHRTSLALALVAAVCLIGAAVLRLQTRRAAALARRERAERTRLEEQLKLAVRLEAAGRLAGSVAHDFNNLLTVINGCTALLEAEINDANHPDRTRKFAAAIRRAGEQAASLTRQLLAFSRQRPVDPYPLDLNDVLAGATDLLERLLGDRIAVQLQLGEGLPRVTAEPGLLVQVLLNLGVNAADAMPGGGTLTLATGPGSSNWVRLTVADTGTGMSADAKGRAFEPGFTTKPAGKGTGLGLSTVHGIVRGLGGRIGLTSEPGHGTTFEIDLPVAPGASNAPAIGPAASGAPARPHAPAVVLLVEDEEAVCVLLRHVLEAAGHTVLAGGTPAEALRLLGQYRGTLDLLLTDVVLPGMSGRALADRVRVAHPTAKVLFMSGYTADELRERGVNDEQADFLHKPFLPHELVERVTQVLAGPCP